MNLIWNTNNFKCSNFREFVKFSMPAANQNCISNGFDHRRLRNSWSRDDSSNSLQVLGLDSPRSTTLGNSSHQLSLTPGSESSLTNTSENALLSSPIMNYVDNIMDYKGFVIDRSNYSPQADDVSTSKLMLDISGAKNTMLNRNNGSPHYSDSSWSTASSNFGDIGFFPSSSVQTCRSDSPNSGSSSHDADCLINVPTNLGMSQFTEQELANLQNLHLINCMSSMSKDQMLQALNVLHSVLRTQPAPRTQQTPPRIENDVLELQARSHRTAAVSGNAEAQFTWHGEFPKRVNKGGPYSRKVFLGGVPYDTTEEMLICSFHQFGNVQVEWPGKDAIAQPKGYAYIIFENEMQVKLLLESCREGVGENEGCYYYKIPTTRRTRPKEVQVIPWSINDSNYSLKTCQKLDSLKTVFVGALHGMMTAEGLFRVMDDLFEGVIYAGIDTDKNKYPIGAGRVTFINYKSYVKAVTAAFVDIKTSKFTKKVQLDPFMEDTPCSQCHIQLGPYFCRENGCFRYFCTGCWKLHHSPMKMHKPLMRISKHTSSSGLTNALSFSSH